MSAITPGVSHHQSLGPLDSRFVDVHDLPWQDTAFAGVRAKTLLVDPGSGCLTALLRMDPGARLPDHEHVAIEQTFVIEGKLVDRDGECTAGNFVWRPAGSRHAAHTPDGALLLGVFQVPNRFFERDGTVTDMLGRDWAAFWGQASNLAPAAG